VNPPGVNLRRRDTRLLHLISERDFVLTQLLAIPSLL